MADEVEAYLDGCLVDYIATHGHTIPTWAVINRLAHADHQQLVGLVAGDGLDRPTHPGRKLHPWAESERFLAAHLLATSGATPEALERIQQQALVPLELSLIGRSRADRLRPEDVIEAGMEALDRYRTGA